MIRPVSSATHSETPRLVYHILTETVLMRLRINYDSDTTELMVPQRIDMASQQRSPNENKKNVTAQVNEGIHKRLIALAESTDMSIAQHLRRAIEEYLDRQEKHKQRDLDL